MTDASVLYQSACDVFDARIRAVGAGQWSASTPCSEWDVRALVNHVTVEDLWAPPLLAGKTMAEVGDAYDGDQLGDDPVAAWTAAVTAAKDAAAAPNVDARTVHLSYGDDSAKEYLMQIFTDNLIHAWDLAAATGGDTDLPADLVDVCSEWFAGMEPTYRKVGVLGPAVQVPDDADVQTRLLARFGRAVASR